MKKLFTLCIPLLLPLMMQAQVLYDNGPYYNSVGTGAGGANESVLYTTTFAMGTIGFGHQLSALNRVADDFTINDCYWRIDSVAFFAYQTGSTTTSTMTAVNVIIWDSIPNKYIYGNVIWGDTTTNRMISTAWSGVYRITETTTGATNRPLMRNVVNMAGLVLPAGTYWLDWQSAGSLASGPWVAPLTPPGVAITGNAFQRQAAANYANLLDGGTGTPAQGLPFIIYGQILDPVAEAGNAADLCELTTVVLGGSPAGSGGVGSLTYSWTPVVSLNDPLLANPTAFPADTTVYMLTVTDSLGCAVIDSVQINVTNLDETVTDGDTIITANATGLTYQWVDCDNGYSVIAGATGQSYEPTVTGNYAVVVSQGLCSDTSICVNVTITGMEENGADVVRLHPNPTTDRVTLDWGFMASEVRYGLTDVTGRDILNGRLNNALRFDMDLTSIPSGIYTLTIELDGQVSLHKVVKE